MESNAWRPWGSILLRCQWKVPSLVALERNPMLGGQWGIILFGGQWKVPSLVTFGRNPMGNVATPLLEECEDDTHTFEMGTWESSEILEISEFDCKGQNTLS
jgi:hypothetical protein